MFRIVNVFVDWLYARKLPEDKECDCETHEEDEYACLREAQLSRLRCYAFGHRLLAPGFRQAVQNDLVDYMVGDHPTSPYYEVVDYAYKNLPAHDPVLQLLIDTHCATYDRCIDDGRKGKSVRQEDLPHAFLIGVMNRYSDIVEKGLVELDRRDDDSYTDVEATQKLARCNYHCHNTADERETCYLAQLTKDREGKQ